MLVYIYSTSIHLPQARDDIKKRNKQKNKIEGKTRTALVMVTGVLFFPFNGIVNSFPRHVFISVGFTDSFLL